MGPERLFRCDACGWRGWLMPLVSIESGLADQAPAPNLAEVDEAVSRSLPAARPHFPAAKPAMTESATRVATGLAVAWPCRSARRRGGVLGRVRVRWSARVGLLAAGLSLCGGRRGSVSARQAPTEVPTAR